MGNRSNRSAKLYSLGAVRPLQGPSIYVLLFLNTVTLFIWHHILPQPLLSQQTPSKPFHLLPPRVYRNYHKRLNFSIPHPFFSFVPFCESSGSSSLFSCLKLFFIPFPFGLLSSSAHQYCTLSLLSSLHTGSLRKHLFLLAPTGQMWVI